MTILSRGDTDWVRKPFYDLDDVVEMPSLELSLTLAGIYDGVTEIEGPF